MRRILACVSLLLVGCPDTSGLMTPPDLAPPADVAFMFPDPCTDKMQDQDETDVDCGGMMCPKCDTGQHCVHGADCASAICDNNACAGPSCTDNIKNGGETDLDCGGG